MSFKQVPGDIERMAQLAREACVYRGGGDSDPQGDSLVDSASQLLERAEGAVPEMAAAAENTRLASAMRRGINAASVAAVYFFAAVQLILLATLAITGGLAGQLFCLARRHR